MWRLIVRRSPLVASPGYVHCPADAPLLLLADCDGSNGYRVLPFREQLQFSANQWRNLGRVCQLPSYCSNNNPIDHRPFFHIRKLATIADAAEHRARSRSNRAHNHTHRSASGR